MSIEDPRSEPAPPVCQAAVEQSRSTACWTVEERAWKQDLPHLPDELVALLATPVVVTASAYGGAIPRRRGG